MEIPTLREGARGCGYRQPGGLYLVCDGAGEDCPKLPIELRVCPTCGGGIKPTRGYTWIEPQPLVKPEPHGTPEHSALCPLSGDAIERAGLIWIGGSFYTPQSFAEEAGRMGISRRIPAVPREFEIGKTWVFLAHREAEWEPCPKCGDLSKGLAPPDCEECGGDGRVPVPAIFYLFRPQRVEYVVSDEEEPEEIERMVKRGIRPVRVEPIEEAG